MVKISQPKTQWNSLLFEMYGNLDKLYKVGGEWATSSRIGIENQFWTSVFESWSAFCKTKTPQNNLEIINSCIWYNSQISKETLYFPKWYNKGILVVGDIVEPSGDIMTLQKIEKIYSIKINFLEYHRMKILI